VLLLQELQTQQNERFGGILLRHCTSITTSKMKQQLRFIQNHFKMQFGRLLLQTLQWYLFIRLYTSKILSLQVFVYENNIYVKQIAPHEQPTNQVTSDGETNTILNGIQSWVYEEEIFSDYSAIWWSKDGAKIAFLRFNESRVPEFDFPLYSASDSYTTDVRLKYPKAGYPNPMVSVAVYDINNQSLHFLVSFLHNFDLIGVGWLKSK
jgi:dipeptidyl aminopeptidase/acylaminoacyl peptidase